MPHISYFVAGQNVGRNRKQPVWPVNVQCLAVISRTSMYTAEVASHSQTTSASSPPFSGQQVALEATFAVILTATSLGNNAITFCT